MFSVSRRFSNRRNVFHFVTFESYSVFIFARQVWGFAIRRREKDSSVFSTTRRIPCSLCFCLLMSSSVISELDFIVIISRVNIKFVKRKIDPEILARQGVFNNFQTSGTNIFFYFVFYAKLYWSPRSTFDTFVFDSTCLNLSFHCRVLMVRSFRPHIANKLHPSSCTSFLKPERLGDMGAKARFLLCCEKWLEMCRFWEIPFIVV